MHTQITFRHMESSDAVRSAIEKRASELEQFYPRIVGCHVVFEQDDHHRQQGRLFRVRIDLDVPGKRLAIGRSPASHEHEDPYVTIRDAFDAARRRLEDFARRQNGRVNQHASKREAPNWRSV